MLKEPFTSQTAREAGIKSGQTRRARAKQLREWERLQAETPESLEAELNRSTLEELKRCSELMQRCRSPRVFAQLAATKERLWSLVLPKIRAKKPVLDARRFKPLPVAQHTWQTTDDWKPVDKEPQSPVTESVKPDCAPSKLDLAPATMPQAPTQPETVNESANAWSPVPNRPLPENDRIMGELKMALCNLYRRPTALVWPDAEQTLLTDIARRPAALQEFQMLVNYRRGLPMDKREFFPNSVARLLERWNETLDRARRPFGQ